MLTEKVTVYRFSGAGPLAGRLAPDGAGCVPPGAAGVAAAAVDGTLPNAIERLIPIFTVKKLGPVP